MSSPTKKKVVARSFSGMDMVIRNKWPAPVDQERVAADWKTRGFSCGPFVDPPGREWNGFVHGANELVTVVEGRLSMTVGAQTREVGPGDEVFIPRGAVHSVKNIHHGTTRWLFGYD